MIAIVDYGMGNAQSVINAVNSLGYNAVLSAKAADLNEASHIILPGVGAFSKAMSNLKELGLIDLLNEQVIKRKKPFLGICLGMQLLADVGHEGGVTNGLGWISGEVIKFNLESQALKVPHVGWNDVSCNLNSAMFLGSEKETQTFYFIHSYYLAAKDEKIITGYCDYGVKFAAAIQKDNIWAVQFHPEKSQANGTSLLKRFLEKR